MSRTIAPAESATETEQNAEISQSCPLCPFEGPDINAVYVHLQTSHRKSSLAADLLDARDC